MSAQTEHGQYHQFQISDEDGPASPDLPRTHKGLVELQDGIVTVHTGDVDVTITLHTNTPSREALSGTRSSKCHCTQHPGSSWCAV
ncbi:hypothetical protein [Streptomyces collinus]|uniref:hypothetical protein n=1 Tax=Streptomyces collinus TaxID=42684 RepID=UPI003690A5F5